MTRRQYETGWRRFETVRCLGGSYYTKAMNRATEYAEVLRAAVCRDVHGVRVSV